MQASRPKNKKREALIMETKKKKKDLPAPLHSGKTLSSKQIDLLF
jgi:hypothetical protein